MIKEIVEKHMLRDGHHAFGPSSWWRVHNCPGSVYMQAVSPKTNSGETKYSERGSELHHAVDDGDEPEEVIDQNLVDMCRDFQSQWDPPGGWFSEKTLDVTRWAFGIEKKVVHGTPDVYSIIENTAILIDWKFGGQPPTKEEARFQLQLNAMMIMIAHDEVEIVDAYIFAPVINSRKELVKLTFVRDLLPDYWAEWNQDVAKAQSENLELAAGKWCTYCTAKNSCPLMQGALSVIESSITIANGGEIYRAAMALEKLAQEAKAAVKELWKKTGQAPVGMVVKKKSGSRYVADIVQLWNTLAAHGVTQEDFLSIVKVPVTKAQGLFSKFATADHTYKSKAAAERDFDRLAGIQHGTDTESLEVEK